MASFSSYEIIYVDDGSNDETLACIRRIATANQSVKYISLARNFGHQAALKVGIGHASGDVVISMDADLQHPPELIITMVDQWRSGHKIINMVRKKGGASYFKILTSHLFYGFVNWISDYRIVPGSSDFRLLDREIVNILNALPEQCVFLRGLIPWLGFEQLNMEYLPDPRYAGVEKYSARKMMQLALTGVTSSSIKPLRLSLLLGVITSTIAVIYAIYAVIIKLYVGTAISGWTSLLISLLLISGVQLTMLGIIGEYLGRVFLEVKGRPAGIIAEQNVKPQASAKEIA